MQHFAAHREAKSLVIVEDHKEALDANSVELLHLRVLAFQGNGLEAGIIPKPPLSLHFQA